ncbi:MAG: DUF4139 domain-containing protein [Fidelibacterota bacterium]
MGKFGRNILVVLSLSVVAYSQSHNATITIYKDGIALVNQPVHWSVEEGFNTVTYSDFSDQIHRDSPFLTLEDGMVYSQRFDDAVFSAEDYYRDRIGTDIRVKIHDNKTIEGTLLDINQKALVLQTRNSIRTIMLGMADYFEFEDQLTEIQYTPELVWNIYVTGQNTATGNLFYLTNGLTWDTSYRLIMQDKSDQAEFIPVALVSNTGNMDFTGLRLRLVEGNLAREARPRPMFRGGAKSLPAMTRESDSAVPEHLELGDFHIYEIEGKHRLQPNQTISMKLYEPRTIHFTKTYVFENTERSRREEPLTVRLSIRNTEDNALGIPLPQGKVELYFRDENGFLTFAGSDLLKQIPREETAELQAGRAFDVIGKRTILNYDRQRKAEEGTVEINVTNHRDEPVQVHVVEHITGDWVIRGETTLYIKDDASTIHFPLELQPEESKTIAYTYRKEFK